MGIASVAESDRTRFLVRGFGTELSIWSYPNHDQALREAQQARRAALGVRLEVELEEARSAPRPKPTRSIKRVRSIKAGGVTRVKSEKVAAQCERFVAALTIQENGCLVRCHVIVNTKGQPVALVRFERANDSRTFERIVPRNRAKISLIPTP